MSDDVVGRTLADYLTTHERAPLGEGLQVLEALLAEVGKAHRTDAADGGLHPGRVMVVAPGRVRILPLAESIAVPDAEAYRSPQQRDGKPLDVRADVYALGVIAYRLLTGVLPYVDGSDEPVDPQQYLPNVVDRVRKSLVIAVQKNLTERFGDALTFRAALTGDSVVALDTPTLRWAVAEGIPVGDTGAADAFANDEVVEESADTSEADAAEASGE